ncbi:MAG: transposase [Proteobacteria bacterium]|nr:transposase [Pseudomonadota bacterium]
MPDWLKKITSLITSSQDSVAAPFNPKDEGNTTILNKHQKLPTAFFNTSSRTKGDITFQLSEPPAKQVIKPICANAKKPVDSKEEEKKVPNEPEDDNLKALKRLRDLPRGTQVDSRIAAIKNLLGETEIFKTLKMLRWPQGVVCPRCHSTNVVRRDPPSNAIDKRHYYICLNCKGDGSPCDFDDFTGLPIGEIRALRQWVLCWYLIGFCSVAQIAKVLGISVQEVMQIASLGNDLTVLPEEKAALQAESRKTQEAGKHRKQVEEQEDNTRSASKAPLKPGYKSKK